MADRRISLSGKVVWVGETQTRERMKDGQTQSMDVRTVVIEEDGGEYPNSIAIEFIKDKCSLLDNVSVGSVIEVGINVRANRTEKNGDVRYFNNVGGWYVKVLETANKPSLEDLPF